MIKKNAFALVLAAITASAAQAEESVDRTLSERGDWVTFETRYKNEPSADNCTAYTYFDGGREYRELNLIVFAIDDQGLEIYAFDDNWDLGNRPVSFNVVVGNKRWNLDGDTYDNSISAILDSRDRAQRLMNALSVGNRVDLETKSGNPLLDFSLSGSRAAMSALADCWARIDVSNSAVSDPFSAGTASDPFAEETDTDPFN